MQLYTAREKQQLADLVDTMISYNLSYHQERTPEGSYTYILDPFVNLHSLPLPLLSPSPSFSLSLFLSLSLSLSLSLFLFLCPSLPFSLMSST